MSAALLGQDVRRGPGATKTWRRRGAGGATVPRALAGLVRAGTSAGRPTLTAGTKPLSQWGGQISDEDAVRAVLLTVDPAILLLVLAGYQVRTVVAAVPATASETAVTDLVNVDLATMRIQRGSLLEWTDPDSSRADAQVALWVEPRYPSVRPGPSGVTLDLSTLQTPLEAQGIDLLFSDDGTGWLRFSWAAGPGSWVDELPGRVDRFVSVARTELAALYASAQPASSGLVVAGLLSAYDPATWTVAGDTALPPALTGFGARVAEAALGDGEPGLSAFLAGELPVPDDQHPVVFGGIRPPATAERFAAADAQPELDACVDEVADRSVAADPAAPGFATDAATDVTALSLTELLLRWQEHDVLDVRSLIAPEEDHYGGYDLRTGLLPARRRPRQRTRPGSGGQRDRRSQCPPAQPAARRHGPAVSTPLRPFLAAALDVFEPLEQALHDGDAFTQLLSNVGWAKTVDDAALAHGGIVAVAESATDLLSSGRRLLAELGSGPGGDTSTDGSSGNLALPGTAARRTRRAVLRAARLAERQGPARGGPPEPSGDRPRPGPKAVVTLGGADRRTVRAARCPGKQRQ